MEYKIKEVRTEKVALSEDRKHISIDYTVNAEAVDGELIIPINTGTTIENIPLSLGDGIPDFAEAEVIKWFNSKYTSK